jgi:hypothetical protein
MDRREYKLQKKNELEIAFQHKFWEAENGCEQPY